MKDIRRKCNLIVDQPSMLLNFVQLFLLIKKKKKKRKKEEVKV